MNPIKTGAVVIGALAVAVAGLTACGRKTEGPANVYAADKPDLGQPNTAVPGLDNRTDPADANRVNPDSVDSSTGYSDRTNTAQRP